MKKESGNASAGRRRGKLQAELLAIAGVGAARRQILARREAVGSGDVTQADVDLVATAMVAARERPYPQAIVAVAGGSLSTVTPLFHDWFMRFAYRDAGTKTVSLEAPARIPLLVQHLVGQLETAVREQLREVPDPMRALVGAVQLGEQQALKAQLAAVTAQRDQLQQSLEALSYRISRLDTELAARRTADEGRQVAIARALESMREVLARFADEPGSVAAARDGGLEELVTEVRRLRTAVSRGRRRRTATPTSSARRSRPKRPPKHRVKPKPPARRNRAGKSRPRK